MHLHEFQAKHLFQHYQIPTPDFFVFSSVAELKQGFPAWGEKGVWIKAQVHAGGRGKAGGVLFAPDRHAAYEIASRLFKKRLVNSQTGPMGLPIDKLLLSPPISIVQESYLAFVCDTEKKCNLLMASPVGGVDIEELAKTSPEQILFQPIPLDGKLRSYHLLRLAKFMHWDPKWAKNGMKIAENLVKLALEVDAQLVEINPLVQTSDETLTALDAKLSIDENSLFRHPSLKEALDLAQLTQQEILAKKAGLSYIALDGNIGCMVNGAGLAMATMDKIQQEGGKAANFLDVGGSATEETISEGFKIILSDPRVKKILVNIFGGIMNCATIASGILGALQTIDLQIPLIVRLEGTDVEKGLNILRESPIKILLAQTLAEAASLSVKTP